ncbi:putative signal transducing protein [Agathobaculum desmolans]|uniref:putative signal transducing protein n=1 Tax=Agathobaculum desmolans TaxID=39484 RepID=UPI00248E47AF|nr:DUF2007 domain-containing protein [Agathobaculum desmolans]
MPWCPKCRAEYREGFIRCSTCDVPLVDTLPEYTAEPQQETALPDGMTKPIAVFTAANRLEAETVCELLRTQGIAVLDRPAAFRQIQAYAGADARFGVEILVDAADTARARVLIDEMKAGLQEQPPDEEELARLAEEQALEMPAQQAEDNASFRLLPVVAAVIAAALVLLYFVTNRM